MFPDFPITGFETLAFAVWFTIFILVSDDFRLSSLERLALFVPASFMGMVIGVNVAHLMKPEEVILLKDLDWQYHIQRLWDWIDWR